MSPFTKAIAADGEPAEKILLVIGQFRHVVAGRAGGHLQWQQMLLARMRRARRGSGLPGGQ